MPRPTPSRPEWLFLAACFLFWSAVLALLPPSLAATDVYLFRDAACNDLAGLGFRTASFEHSRSFLPVLYSSYTPATLWIFAAIARFLGTGSLIARVYPHLWALPLDAITLFAGLRFLAERWPRWIFLVLLGLVLPYGLIGPIGERPEPVSLVVLVLLIVVMRQRPGVATAALAGLCGGIAFLCQPFAGILAVALIAGWLVFAGLSSDGIDRLPLKASAALVAIAGLLFTLPVAITAAAFHQRDPQSLHRFWKQVTDAGIGRDAGYTAGEMAAFPAKPATGLHKYKDALAFHGGLGPIHLLDLGGAALIAVLWLLLVLRAKGPSPARWALLLAGLACFLLPVAVFPLQGNYLKLTRVLFPLLLACNWASVRTTLRHTAVIPALLAINAIVVLPAVGISLLTDWQSRASYADARRQVVELRAYLGRYPLRGKVVLVPSTHYFLYKDAVGNLYNPAYLSPREDPNQIAAIANCYASTRNFQPGTLPLLAFVGGRTWHRLSTAGGPVTVTLFHHRLMSRNWSMGCDLYVPAEK